MASTEAQRTLGRKPGKDGRIVNLKSHALYSKTFAHKIAKNYRTHLKPTRTTDWNTLVAKATAIIKAASFEVDSGAKDVASMTAAQSVSGVKVTSSLALTPPVLLYKQIGYLRIRDYDKIPKKCQTTDLLPKWLAKVIDLESTSIFKERNAQHEVDAAKVIDPQSDSGNDELNAQHEDTAADHDSTNTTQSNAIGSTAQSVLQQHRVPLKEISANIRSTPIPTSASNVHHRCTDKETVCLQDIEASASDDYYDGLFREYIHTTECSDIHQPFAVDAEHQQPLGSL